MKDNSLLKNETESPSQQKINKEIIDIKNSCLSNQPSHIEDAHQNRREKRLFSSFNESDSFYDNFLDSIKYERNNQYINSVQGTPKRYAKKIEKKINIVSDKREFKRNKCNIKSEFENNCNNNNNVGNKVFIYNQNESVKFNGGIGEVVEDVFGNRPHGKKKSNRNGVGIEKNDKVLSNLIKENLKQASLKGNNKNRMKSQKRGENRSNNNNNIEHNNVSDNPPMQRKKFFSQKLFCCLNSKGDI